jgi:hypothetical protein
MTKEDCSRVIYMSLSQLLEHAKTCENEKCLAVRFVKLIESPPNPPKGGGEDK